MRSLVPLQEVPKAMGVQVGKEVTMIWKWLNWFFGYSGIMYAEDERPAKKSLVHALRRLFGGAVQYGTPDAKLLMASQAVRRPLRRYRCKVCGVYFWSIRKRDVCWKWSCVKQT